jgi:hypothetical protein
MSFICDRCGEAQKDKVKPVRVVTKRRTRKNGSEEIAKEELRCPKCRR